MRVSWVDTDAAGVVHFSNYFRFFEKAEEEFYNKLGFNFDKINEKYGIWFPRVEAYCKYKSPSKFNDILEIEIHLEELKEKAVKYGFKVHNRTTEKEAAEGYVVIVAADKKKNKAVRIPEEIKRKLMRFFGRI